MQLYDLSVDPGEMNNVAQSHPERVERMLALLRTVVEREANDGGEWWGKLPWKAGAGGGAGGGAVGGGGDAWNGV